MAQSFIALQGANISLQDGAYLSVHGDVILGKDGAFDNSDSIFLFGDWVNNSGHRGFTSTGEGRVILAGDTQTITGADITHFHNLELTGSGVKHATLDVVVENHLALNDREFNVHANKVSVLNPDTGSVSYNGGYVSSEDSGGLERFTASMNPYLFPVGSSVGTFRFRPVVITPHSADTNAYAVRFANVNPTREGFDRAVREPRLCLVNPAWYHRIYHTYGGDTVTMDLLFDPLADADYTCLAHWQNLPQWEIISRQKQAGYSGVFDAFRISQWSGFTSPAFALGIASHKLPFELSDASICAGDTVSIMAEEAHQWYDFTIDGETVQSGNQSMHTINGLVDSIEVFVIATDTNCQYFSDTLTVTVHPLPVLIAGVDTTVLPGAPVPLHVSGASQYLWYPDSVINCNDCPDPIAISSNTTTLYVTGIGENGCRSTDSVVIIVNANLDPEGVLFIPNAITPNDDGVNEVWNIRNLHLYPDNEVIIVNRWGDEVFRAKPYLNNWKGTWNDKPLPEGTYYYILKLNHGSATLSGPLTVIR